MESLLNNILEKTLNSLNYPYSKNNRLVQLSNRPDLCDYQSNIAYSLAKTFGKNPRDVAQIICNELSKNENFKDVSVAGNGFINIKLSDGFISEYINNLLKKPELRINKNKKQKMVVIDFGGYNIGKDLHIGHIRSTIIGETVARICRAKGDKVISDVHLGDWGKPMGLIITEIRERGLSKTGVTLDDLSTIYPTASEKAKKDPIYNERALQATYELQNGDAEATRIWRQFTDLSIHKAKELAESLGANFDVWYGESTVDKITRALVEKWKKDNTAILDNGAYIIPLTEKDTGGKKLPPVIIEKTNGGLMYASTDLGTIADRMDKWNPDEILYFTDNRQIMHFEQVFATAYKTKLVDKNKTVLKHFPFGTICGEDGKPLKSRDGGNVKLSDVTEEAIEKGIAKLKDKDFTEEEKKEIGKSVGLSCLKFADLMNDLTQSYVFNLDKATASEGKTAAYILYSIVRINSILNKSDSKNYANNKINIAKTDTEKKLQLQLIRISDVIDQAYLTKKPHILCEYLFELAQSFNAFYANNEILNKHENIAQLTKEIMESLCNLLGLFTVEKM